MFQVFILRYLLFTGRCYRCLVVWLAGLKVAAVSGRQSRPAEHVQSTSSECYDRPDMKSVLLKWRLLITKVDIYKVDSGADWTWCRHCRIRQLIVSALQESDLVFSNIRKYQKTNQNELSKYNDLNLSLLLCHKSLIRIIKPWVYKNIRCTQQATENRKKIIFSVIKLISNFKLSLKNHFLFTGIT